MRFIRSQAHCSGPWEFSRTVPGSPHGKAPITKARGSPLTDASHAKSLSSFKSLSPNKTIHLSNPIAAGYPNPHVS